MRIESNFRDYYDGVQAQGQDDHVSYHRATVDLFFNCKKHPLFKEIMDLSGIHKVVGDSYYFHYPALEITHHLLGVCGKYYPFIHANYVELNPYRNEFERYIYSIEEYEQLLNDLPNKKFRENQWEQYLNGRKRLRRFGNKKHKSSNWKESVQNFFGFEGYEEHELFRRENTPLLHLVLHNIPAVVNDQWAVDNFAVITIDPALHPFQFYRIKDAYTMFQEIEMYMGGVLGVGNPEMVEISDQKRIEKHGYDKWSFRRHSSQNKKRKQKNKKGK